MYIAAAYYEAGFIAGQQLAWRGGCTMRNSRIQLSFPIYRAAVARGNSPLTQHALRYMYIYTTCYVASPLKLKQAIMENSF